jgi:hypothetical protein
VRGCPLNNLALELSLMDTDFRAAMGEIFTDWRAALAQALRSEMGSGASRREAEELASFVVAAYSGAMAMAKAAQDSGPLKACARRLVELVPRSEPLRPRGA